MKAFTKERLEALLKSKIGGRSFTPKIASALSLAYRAHEGQYRERAVQDNSPIPYIVHPVGVAMIAAELWPDSGLADEYDDVISACLTHDTLEDSGILPEELAEATSERVLELVLSLTKPSTHTYRNRETRNAAHFNEIEKSGSTAIFIKICDNLHNLSRPEATPLGLLRKTIDRARVSYLPMLERSKLSPHIRERFLGAIQAANDFSLKAEISRHAQGPHGEVGTAFAYCVERARRKLLEPHDIADALAIATSAREACLLSPTAFQSRIDELNPQLDVAQRKEGYTRLMQGGDLRICDTREFSITQDRTVVRAIIIPPNQLGAIRDTILLFLSADAPVWITPATVQGLATVLAERSVVRQTAKISEMARLLRSSGIDLDPGTAARLDLTMEDIEEMRQRLSVAKVAQLHLQKNLFERFPANIMSRIERQETRIKSADSIIRKMKHKSVDLAGIEDLVGFRLIVRNTHDRERVSDYAQSQLSVAGFHATGPMEVKALRTGRGYVAIHIYSRINPVGGLAPPVGLEVQVRTILDDAWARISQVIDYKKANVVSKRNEKALSRLRAAIDQLEEDIWKVPVD